MCAKSFNLKNSIKKTQSILLKVCVYLIIFFFFFAANAAFVDFGHCMYSFCFVPVIDVSQAITAC